MKRDFQMDDDSDEEKDNLVNNQDYQPKMNNYV